MKFLFILTTMFMVSCTMLLFYKVEVSSKEDEFYKTLGRYNEKGLLRKDDEKTKYYIHLFGSVESLKRTIDRGVKQKRMHKSFFTAHYQPENEDILHIYIGAKKKDLDNFPVKPKHIKEKTIDDKKYIIYSYYSGIVEHVDVFIYNNEVEKYECLLFKDGP